MTSPMIEPQPRITLFEGGFRPFFMLTALYGVLSVAYWIFAYAGAIPVPETFTPAVWHGHEMVYGFALAAACGFLMTVIPAWTGTPPLSAAALGGAVAMWVAGRAAFWFGDWLNAEAIALMDLALPAALVAFATQRLCQARQMRNAPFVLATGLLLVGNGLVHAENLGWTDDTALAGVHLGMHVFALLIVLIGGRIIPMFTGNMFRMAGKPWQPTKHPVIEGLCIAGVVAVAGLDLAGVEGTVSAAAAAVAAAALFVRMAKWHSHRTLGNPMLWVLHLGHLWLPVGYAIKVAVDLEIGDFMPDAYIHALSTGAMGTAILAVMTRVSLAHSGRPLEPAKTIVVAYWLILAAALARVFGPIAHFDAYHHWVTASGVLWAGAFALFAVVYSPILLGSRDDAPKF